MGRLTTVFGTAQGLLFAVGEGGRGEARLPRAVQRDPYGAGVCGPRRRRLLGDRGGGREV